jgi:hypothetical protein
MSIECPFLGHEFKKKEEIGSGLLMPYAEVVIRGILIRKGLVFSLRICYVALYEHVRIRGQTKREFFSRRRTFAPEG